MENPLRFLYSLHGVGGSQVPVFDGLHRMADLGMQAVDHCIDLLGQLMRADGQVPYLVGYHRETAPLLPRPGCLDGGIECQ
ncbi:hypothetical protein D3C86_1883390 [compost metagenome]